MSDALTEMLMSADGIYPPVFSFDVVDQWDDGELERCVAADLLRPALPAKTLTCFECGEMEEVLVLHDSRTELPHAYLRCTTFGPVEIPLKRLKQWELSIEQLLDVVFADVKLTGSREEIVRDRVWRLGKTRWAGTSRNVFFARGLHRSDAWQTINEAKPTPRSVVFVPGRLPKADSRIEVNPLVIPLLLAVSEDATGNRLDHEYVETEIAEAVARQDAKSVEKPRSAQRGSRLAIVEALTQEMKEHLRAARDYALDTLDRTGTPQLLPRPQRGFLAKNLGVHKSSVTRAFKDREANELRLLWELAADLDRILEHAGCHK